MHRAWHLDVRSVTDQEQAYQNAASFVPKLATKVMQWLDPQKDDVILDVGCGGMSHIHPSSDSTHTFRILC
jgi:protein-L-isoaspartate O-methyltransferase